ncbi:MAG: TonB-dependent receptor [Chitinophagales bacterium]|nr:TonB-dependent receptor [Chitinophagales bacterium]
MKKLNFGFLLLTFTLCQYAFSQQKIKVRITDKKTNEFLYGANIQWQHTASGATTNEFGIADLDMPNRLPDYIVITYVGYQTDTILISNPTDVNIQLAPEIQLGEVKIKGKRQTNFISSINPIKTEKIEAGELKKAACCNLSESFQTNASADVNYSDAVTGAKEIRLLGLSGIYVQNLLEGVPVMRGVTATFGLDNIPAPWMKSIAVSKGVPSVKNSYEGISGSMNIEFKNSFNDTTKLFFDMFGNQNGRIETNLLLNHKINPKLGTMLMANGAFVPLKQDMNHDGFLDQPVLKQYNLLNRWNYQGDKLEGQYMIKVLSENRIAGQTSIHHQQNDSLPLYDININTKRVEVFAKTGYIFTEENSLGTQFSGVYHQQQSNYGSKDFNTTQGSFTGTFLYQTTVKNDNHILVGGANFVYDKIDEQLDSLKFNRNDIVPGIFAEYTFKWNNKITIVTGIRGDYHSRAGFQFNPRIHAKFSLTDKTTLRIAAGSGFRAPNILTENQSLLASSRNIIFQENPTKEVAWNYGISFTQKFNLFNREGNLSVDFFRTDFLKQAVIDIDNADGNATISNLYGKSFSNSLLVEFNFEALKGLDVKIAYRLEDVRTTYHSVLLQKPLQALNKGLIALSYKTPNQQWQFDVNTSINGKRRLPNSFEGDAGKRYSPHYVLLNAQILKYFKHAELFAGCEDITNYRQKIPILGVPNTSYFDTYQVYAPIMGATVYGGFRIFIN